MMRTLPLVTDWAQDIFREPYPQGIVENYMTDIHKICQYVLGLREKKARKLGLSSEAIPTYLRRTVYEVVNDSGAMLYPYAHVLPDSALVIPLSAQQILDKLSSREQINPDEILLRTRDGFTKVEIYNSALGAPFIMGALMERSSPFSELREQFRGPEYTHIRARRFELTDEVVDGRRVYAEL